MSTILIATIRSEEQIRPLLDEIRQTITGAHKLVVASNQASVAVNVNLGLNNAEGEFILKVDDDISGFSLGWDERLIEPLRQDPMIGVVSARLLNIDGSVQHTCSWDVNMHPSVSITSRPIVPFCCAAFRNDGTRMDEIYVGSGYDDSDFCCQLRMAKADVKFAIHNEVRVIHKNEQKNAHFSHNGELFRAKWANIQFPDGKGLVE